MSLRGDDSLRISLLTSAALVAFAANSLLCRSALGSAAIDAASFSSLRLASGALTLAALSRFGRRPAPSERGSWLSAAALFLYVAAFSFAYLSLPAGTGALILFGAVQTTMIVAGLVAGERPRLPEWAGLLVAVGGLILLFFPGLTAPSPRGGALMAVAGVSWGGYSLRGRGTVNPLAVTCDNFGRAVPLALALNLVMVPTAFLTPKGVLLAMLSGSLASGGGYVLWYAVVRRMTATLAATVQLAVPVLATAGGVVLLRETLTLRLVVASLAILGGVTLAVRSHARSSRQRRD